LADAAGQPVDRARQAVRDTILLRVADARSAGVLAALAVGDQAAIARAEHGGIRDEALQQRRVLVELAVVAVREEQVATRPVRE
jgi:hypothetical protein